jgi:predicted transcriptional regulator of viral defense system
MPENCIEQKVVKSGFINVSSPALTALDLVSYSSRAGGISRVASVLLELTDSVDFDILDEKLLISEPRATIQRLGHLLESVLDEAELASALYDKCQQTGLMFNRIDLVLGQEGHRLSYDSKWKIVVNYGVGRPLH